MPTTLICVLAIALALLGPAPARAAAPVEVDSIPLDLSGIAGPNHRLGELELLAAFELSSKDARFGGLSALMHDDGALLAASDRGTLWSARLDLAHDGSLLGLRGWTIENVGVADGSWPPDLEALSRLTDGAVIAAAEGPSRGLLLIGNEPPWLPLVARELVDQPSNEGVEAMAELADGGLLTLGEAEIDDGVHEVVVFGPGATRRLRYATDAGFRPTDAQRIGAFMLVLERRLSFLGGLEASIMLVDLAETPPAAGAILRGRELARLGVSSISENFEGLTAERQSDGRLLIYVVSDDNFLPVQRTLLLQLRSAPLL